jgi:DNA repair protein RadA/Sms
MAKTKIAYYCSNCGHEEPKWVGKCNACGQWNTFTEEVISNKKSDGKLPRKFVSHERPQKIKDITLGTEERIDIKMGEVNRILGGGLVKGSLVLLGGEPGIGKSTLILQMALMLENTILYVSGEESVKQIKLRADRIGTANDKCYLLSETSLENILTQLDNVKPDIVVVDSVQTIATDIIDSAPGSVSQVRECTSRLLQYAKSNAVPVFLIGHITKDGNIAGPKVLEHIVDTVLQFEGDMHNNYRILRSKKNRFGSTSELGIFEMLSDGLKEILNPSKVLLSEYDDSLSGQAVAATIDGGRSFLIEVQALVSTAAYGTPQRSATGFDTRRLNMLLAVLEKRANFKISAKDVFLNIAGGIKVNDPAIDLAVIAAILSSSADIAVSSKFCFAGEIGLSGEVRPVARIDQRISEAEKLGFQKIFISKYNKDLDIKNRNIEVVVISKIEEFLRSLFA